jgi:uncharacterized protein YifN (PemK superfamily)
VLRVGGEDCGVKAGGCEGQFGEEVGQVCDVGTEEWERRVKGEWTGERVMVVIARLGRRRNISLSCIVAAISKVRSHRSLDACLRVEMKSKNSNKGNH